MHSQIRERDQLPGLSAAAGTGPDDHRRLAARLVAAARECLGTPWVHQARVVGHGLDCVGMLVYAINRAGVRVNDVGNYPQQNGGGRWLLSELGAQLDRVPPFDTRVGDVLAFSWAVAPWHVGIVCNVSPLTMIHSWKQVGRCVEMQLNEQWRRRIHSVWRVRAAVMGIT